MARFTHSDIHVGESVQVSGATDREAYIRQTLERLRTEKLKQADIEVAEILAQARQQAAGILANAEEQAIGIVAEGEGRRTSILEAAQKEGYDIGYADGYRDGRDTAEDDSKTLMVSANVLLERAYDAQEQVIGEFAPKATAIMQTITAKILHRAMDEFTADQWQQWFLGVLTDLHSHGKFRIVVGAASFREFQSFSPALAQTLGGLDRLRFEVDPNLAPYEMYVITDEGTVDISPTSQLAAFLQGIEPHLELRPVVAEQLNPHDETEALDNLQKAMFETITGRSADGENFTPSTAPLATPVEDASLAIEVDATNDDIGEPTPYSPAEMPLDDTQRQPLANDMNAADEPALAPSLDDDEDAPSFNLDMGN